MLKLPKRFGPHEPSPLPNWWVKVGSQPHTVTGLRHAPAYSQGDYINALLIEFDTPGLTAIFLGQRYIEETFSTAWRAYRDRMMRIDQLLRLPTRNPVNGHPYWWGWGDDGKPYWLSPYDMQLKKRLMPPHDFGAEVPPKTRGPWFMPLGPAANERPAQAQP